MKLTRLYYGALVMLMSFTFGQCSILTTTVPTNIDVDVIEDEINPMIDLDGYRVILTPIDTSITDISLGTLTTTSENSKVRLSFTAPAKRDTSVADTALVSKIYIIDNEDVGYTDQDGVYTAQITVEIGEAYHGFYWIRIAAICKGHRGKYSTELVYLRIE